MNANETPSAPKEILLVDDNADTIHMLSRILKREGYRIVVAMDGEKALEIVRETPPDLVILDLDLPKIPGEEVCRTLRKNEKTRAIPVVILSGKSDDVDRIIGRVIGADRYMTKPCDIKELIDTINNLNRPRG